MDDLRTLKERAQAFLDKGKHERALPVLIELSRREPRSSRWPQKLGEAHHKLGRSEQAVAAFIDAAQLLADEGFLVKAIALCKVALGVAPQHADALALLERLCLASRPPSPPRPAPAIAAAPALAPPGPDTEAAPPPRKRTIPPGGCLGEVRLAEVIPRAQPRGEQEAAMFEIPIGDDELDGALVGLEPARAPRLPKTPIFSELPPLALQQLVEELTVRELEHGATVIGEGEQGDSLFVIVEGQVSVQRRAPHAIALGQLGEGAFFGEFAWLTRRPRSATVTAVGPVTLLEIPREVMASLVDEHPAMLTVLLRFFRERLVHNLISNAELFAPFTDAERHELAARFALLEVDGGYELIREGECADGLYLLLCGELEVWRQSAGGERQIASLGEGNVVGEISMLSHGPAVASIRALRRSWLLKLPHADFQEIILTHPQVLAFLSELAERRQDELRAMASEELPYLEHQLELIRRCPSQNSECECPPRSSVEIPARRDAISRR